MAWHLLLRHQAWEVQGCACISAAEGLQCTPGVLLQQEWLKVVESGLHTVHRLQSVPSVQAGATSQRLPP